VPACSTLPTQLLALAIGGVVHTLANPKRQQQKGSQQLKYMQSYLLSLLHNTAQLVVASD